MSEFMRKDESIYNIPQRFADVNLETCPFCREQNPKWLVKEQWRLLGKDYYFKCPQCESILKIDQDDVTGLAYAKASPSGKKKLRQNKILNVPYVTVVKIGLDVKTEKNMVLQDEELPLPKLKEICDGLK